MSNYKIQIYILEKGVLIPQKAIDDVKFLFLIIINIIFTSYMTIYVIKCFYLIDNANFHHSESIFYPFALCLCLDDTGGLMREKGTCALGRWGVSLRLSMRSTTSRAKTWGHVFPCHMTRSNTCTVTSSGRSPQW